VLYADVVSLLVGSILTIKKNTGSLVVAYKEVGLEANADKSKYMAMSRDQNSGCSHNIKTVNSAFERAEQFQMFGNNLNVSELYSGRN
jgi:hypothetical protein